MRSDNVAVMDIGSSCIRVLIGDNGVNETFAVNGLGECEYAGYYEGEFLEQDKLKEVISKAVSDAESSAFLAVNKLFVGVPADFSVCTTKTISQNFGSKIKISNELITLIYKECNDMALNKDYILVSCSPISFILDDGRKTVDVIGQKTTKLTAVVSLIYAERKFIDIINKTLKSIGIASVEYIPAPLAEAMYLLEPERREEVALIVDCGYIASSVAIVKGDGLLSLKAFSVGGAHISADLSECLNLSFNESEQLRKQIILSVVPSDKDNYEVIRKDSILPVPMLKTNEIVTARLEMIAALVNKCLQGYKIEYSKMPYYLTGGGITGIKGAREVFSKVLDNNINIIVPSDVHMAKAHYSSLLGILHMALNQRKPKKRLFGFLAKSKKR